MRWCTAQPLARMHLENQEYNLNNRGGEIVSTLEKEEYCLIEGAVCRAGRRINPDTTVDEEESTRKCLTTRAANSKYEKTAGHGGGWSQFILPPTLSSIFNTTTVRYHSNNKNVNKEEQTRKCGTTLEPLVQDRGGHQ